MPSFTTGPWEVRERETTIRTGDMYAEDGFTSYVLGFDVFGPNDRPIVGPDGIPALDTDEANAHLIAAAPDLLEALKEMAGYYGHHLATAEFPTEAANMEAALAAIAKAEGPTPVSAQ